jgi:glycosyltransferase involved in cell wall biosynthesis
MNKSSAAKERETERVAFFLPSLRGGGAEKVTVNLAKGLHERGIAVDLVLAKAEGPYLKQVPEGVRIVDLGTGRVVTALPKLVRYLRDNRPTALIAGISHCNVVAALARKLARVPLTLLAVEHSTLSRTKTTAKTLRSRFMSVFLQLVYPGVDRVVAVSQGVAIDLNEQLNLPKNKVAVVYNPIVDAELLELSRQPVDHPFLAADAPPVFLAVGRMTEPKDFATVLKAFAFVRKQRPCRLIVLGDGPDRPMLEGLAQELGISDDVSMPGFTDNPYAYMSRAAAFVLSSRYEGLPTVLVEALACGTTVIATDCPSGPREIVKDRVNGHLIPVGDEKMMASVLFEVIDGKPKPRHTAGTREADRALGIERFRLDTATDRYLDLLR